MRCMRYVGKNPLVDTVLLNRIVRHGDTVVVSDNVVFDLIKKGFELCAAEGDALPEKPMAQGEYEKWQNTH